MQTTRTLRPRRARAAGSHAPHPDEKLRVYERGNSLPKKDREVDDLIDRFHSDPVVQARCRQIRQAAAEYLEEFVVHYGNGRHGRGYRATRPIPSGTEIAFYTGRLEKVAHASCCHLISIGFTELGYRLTVDGTPPLDRPLPVGSMQLVGHSCTPNCDTDHLETASTLELVILRTNREITVSEEVTFSYGGSFWRTRSTLRGPAPAGQQLIQCACARPCPNDFARFEKASPSRPGRADPPNSPRTERGPPSQLGPVVSPRAGLTRQADPGQPRNEPLPHPKRARMATSEPAPSTSPTDSGRPGREPSALRRPTREASMEPDPSPAQAPFSSPDRGPVRVPSPAASVDASDDEEGYQRMLTSGTIASINVGPIGLASSFAALGPVLARRPIAVLIQEAHVPAGQLQSLRALVHKSFPAYQVFTSRKARAGGRVDTVTLVHIRMAARASLLDVSREFAPIAGQAPEALARVHFVRLLDPEGQVALLLGNVHQYQAGDSPQQTAVLSLIKSVITRWGPVSQHVVIGGDWNASLAPREGYSVETVTGGADARLAQWLRELGLHYAAPRHPTWTDGRRQAVLDAFVVREAGSVDQPSVVASHDPRHDHRVVIAALLDDRVGPMPELEALRKPVRLKLEGLREPAKRSSYLKRAEEAVGHMSEADGAACPFARLARMKGEMLSAARNILGTRGGTVRALLPCYSPAFRKLAAYIRLLRAVRQELWARRGLGVVRPASRALRRLWHRDQEVLPEGTTFQALGGLAGDADWSRRAVAGLRARLHSADEELRRLRSSEMKEESEKRRQAAIDNFWHGGGLRRFLHPPSPSLHSPILRGQVPTSVTIAGGNLAQVPRDLGKSPVPGPHGLTVEVASRQQLVAALLATEQSGAQVIAMGSRPGYIIDRRERVAVWEHWLGDAAGATKQRCRHCTAQALRMIPGLTRASTWWCGACSRVTSPVVNRSEYVSLPFPTEGIARAPAGATLRGPIAREDLDWQLSQLRKGGAPGPDEIPYELLATAPEAVKSALLECLNAILVDGRQPPPDWLGGLVRFLPKPGGDPLEPGSYRPVCLLNTTYKVLTAIVNDRLYRMCETYGLLDPSQEGFRRLRCTQRQVQSLHWIIEEASRKESTLYIAYIDFENAFNSVDHEALFRWLDELRVPDLDLLRALYNNAHYEADLPYGRSAPVYMLRGTKQGDILSPTLFNLFFNALLIGLRQSGVGFRSVSGLRANSRGFADDVAISTATPAGMMRLLEVVSKFCSWSGMRVKLKKTVITAFDYKKRTDLPTDGIRYNGVALVSLPAHESFRYLGVRASLAGRKGSVGPGTADEVLHVLSSTKELTRLLADHQIPMSFIVPAMRMVAAARFRYSAALVPWTDAELEELFKVWMQVERAAWKLQRSFPSAQFRLPPDTGGTPIDHPRVVLVQALATHVRQLVALPDGLRESTIRSYRQLCTSCGCTNERELSRYLAKEKKPRRCPIARLLRACGQLGMELKLPDCLSAGKAAREVSWFALLEHIRDRVALDSAPARTGLIGQDDPGQSGSGSSPLSPPARPATSDPAGPPAQVDHSHHDNLRRGQTAGRDELACIERHWTTVRARLRSRGIHFPRQLLLDRTAAHAVWLLPQQMSGNPGWLKPLRRLLSRVDVPALFHSLDRGEGATEPPAHQVLVHLVLSALKTPTASQQLSAIFADDRWLQVRSSAPMERWLSALRQEGVEPPMETVDNRRQAAVEMLRALGSSLRDRGRLQRLCVWLAPSLYTVGPDRDASADDPFTPIEPLTREFVTLITDDGCLDSGVTQVGEFRLVTHKGVAKIVQGSGQHVGTVNMGRWRMLAEEHDPAVLARALPGWIAQVEAEERSRGVPSHQLWLGIRRAFRADVVVGCNPLIAPACFRAALCGRIGMGWGQHEAKVRQVINMLCLPPDIMRTIANRLRPSAPWLALTRAQSLTPVAEECLQRAGTRLLTWRSGAIVAAGAGVWRKAQVRSVQSKEAWTLWASAQTAESEGRQLKKELQALTLTRDGTVPLDRSCPSFREARLGPAGSHLSYAGVVVATDGSLKDDGRMGAAYVCLDNQLPSRSFVVLGPPSSLRGELSAIDEVVADAPLDKDLSVLTDSLTSILKLRNLQRQDFAEWLHGHPEKALLESLVKRINERARAQVFTRIIKVPAHRAHALNEAADAAASRAATEADDESVALSHTDSETVRFYVRGRLTEWGTGVRKALAQSAASQYHSHLTSLAQLQEDRGGGGAVSLTAQWLLRPDQGRQYLGEALAEMRTGATKRRVMQTIAGVFPCRALLHRWGRAPSPQCLLCNGATETVAHSQCWCTALKNARIAAHHAIAGRILDMLKTHSVDRWQFHPELAVSSLRAIDVPLDLLDPWNRMVDELDEMDIDDDPTGDENSQVLTRLRPDVWAISWSQRQVLLLELTRAHDWRQDWASTTDTFKLQRYALLRQRMQDLLPRGWVVETVPLTVGIRGSLHEPTWRGILGRFGIAAQITQKHFLRNLTRQALEELDNMYGVRSEALRRLQTGPDAQRSIQ